MSLFPFNTDWSRKAQSDVKSTHTDLKSIVHVDLGSPAVEDTDWIVASADMKVGAYTLAHTAPDVPRNITVKVTATDAADTMGTVVVVGTNMNGEALTETITPSAGSTVAGTKAFKTVTSVTGAGWVTGGGADKIEVGFGAKVGLPDKLPSNTVLAAILDGTREGTAPTVTASSSDLSLNTVDFSTAWSSSKAAEVYYIV